MNLKEALKTVELIIMTKEVPLLIGESGIGKTSLARELSKMKGYYLVSIDGNLLKEGEIGGLPIVENEEYIKNGTRSIRKITKYAIHSKLSEIDDILSNEENEVLLFIDELNRCEHSVQQELMNLILNREINGYRLSDKVHIIAAMNPSNKYNNYNNSDYQVTDMDPAQEDRFVWIDIESDFKQWMGWALDSGNIHENIIEFLSNFPEYFHMPHSEETIKATPRSWERVSKAYKIYKQNTKSFSIDILYNSIKGNVGTTIAQDFISYIKEIRNPIIKPKDIFGDNILNFDLKEKIRKENHSRLYIIAKNCLKYLETLKNERDSKINLFSDVLSFYPKDLRLGIMQEIKGESSKDLYQEFLNDDRFIEVFFEIYS